MSLPSSRCPSCPCCHRGHTHSPCSVPYGPCRAASPCLRARGVAAILVLAKEGLAEPHLHLSGVIVHGDWRGPPGPWLPIPRLPAPSTVGSLPLYCSRGSGFWWEEPRLPFGTQAAWLEERLRSPGGVWGKNGKETDSCPSPPQQRPPSIGSFITKLPLLGRAPSGQELGATRKMKEKGTQIEQSQSVGPGAVPSWV